MFPILPKIPDMFPILSKNPNMFPIKSLEKSGPGREHIGTRPGTYWELFKKILENFSTFSYSNQCYSSANYATVVLNYRT